MDPVQGGVVQLGGKEIVYPIRRCPDPTPAKTKMPYRDLGFHGTCNVQQHCRSEHNALRSNPPSGGCLDLDDGDLREEVEEVCVHEEERKGGDCHVFVSQVLMFVATSASTLHPCVGRTSSSYLHP